MTILGVARGSGAWTRRHSSARAVGSSIRGLRDLLTPREHDSDASAVGPRRFDVASRAGAVLTRRRCGVGLPRCPNRCLRGGVDAPDGHWRRWAADSLRGCGWRRRDSGRDLAAAVPRLHQTPDLADLGLDAWVPPSRGFELPTPGETAGKSGRCWDTRRTRGHRDPHPVSVHDQRSRMPAQRHQRPVATRIAGPTPGTFSGRGHKTGVRVAAHHRADRGHRELPDRHPGDLPAPPRRIGKDRPGPPGEPALVHPDQRRPHITTRPQHREAAARLRRRQPQTHPRGAKQHLPTIAAPYDIPPRKRSRSGQ
jgi:hypothetical protein